MGMYVDLWSWLFRGQMGTEGLLQSACELFYTLLWTLLLHVVVASLSVSPLEFLGEHHLIVSVRIVGYIILIALRSAGLSYFTDSTQDKDFMDTSPLKEGSTA